MIDFNYVIFQKDHGYYLKNLFNRLWDNIEAHCNFKYRDIKDHSKRIEELGRTLWKGEISKMILGTDTGLLSFIELIERICREPMIPDLKNYAKFFPQYLDCPSDSKQMPINLRTWHATNELLKLRGLTIVEDYLYETLNSEGAVVNPIDREERTKDFNDDCIFVYAMRVLYQVRCNLIHPSNSDFFYRARESVLLHYTCLALFEILRMLVQI